jgi:hypothetical protein
MFIIRDRALALMLLVFLYLWSGILGCAITSKVKVREEETEPALEMRQAVREEAVSPPGSVSLEWDANTAPDLAGYNIYYGTSSRDYDESIDVGNYTSITISDLEVGETYYFAVTLYLNDGSESDFSNEVRHTISEGTTLLLIGLGPTGEGQVEVLDPDFDKLRWLMVQWSDYNTANGESYIASGDIDGDGKGEIVIGLGPVSGNSSIPSGYFEIFDDDYSHLSWGRITWPSYNSSNGETRPACGDVDGDGKDEIIIGLGSGPSNGGWIQIFDYEAGKTTHKAWMQVNWPAYNSSNGETWPACGDVDGDGKDEIIIGLGSYSANGGWFEIFDDASAGYAHLEWMRASGTDYNSSNGETRPACGDVDGDGKDEIIIGLGSYPAEGGWFEVFDDASAGYAHLARLRVSWSKYNSSNGETWPTCGDVDGDGKDEIIIGLGSYSANGGWFEIFDDASVGYAHLAWPRVHWTDYNSTNGETRPAMMQK